MDEEYSSEAIVLSPCKTARCNSPDNHKLMYVGIEVSERSGCTLKTSRVICLIEEDGMG
jgi:hypothetical protein